jgi:hypothetical protein
MDKQTKEKMEAVMRGALETDAIRMLVEEVVNLIKNPPPPGGGLQPHASTHEIGGSDPVTPDSIGAVPASGGSMTGFLTPTFEVVEDTDGDDQVTLQDATQCAMITTKDLNIEPNGMYMLTVNSTRISPTTPVFVLYAGGNETGLPLILACLTDTNKCQIAMINFDQNNNLTGQVKISLRIL